MAVPLTTSINDAYEFLDISSTAYLLLRKALTRFEKVANVDQSKAVVEAAVNNMARANQRYSVNKGQPFEFSENMQYLFMYAMGILKSQIVNIPIMMNPLDTVDKLVYQRFLANSMSPEELLYLYSPQVICISDANLSEAEFPALEVLSRSSIHQGGIFLLFNSF